MPQNKDKIQRTLKDHNRLALFLDYDGTLADFAEHPDIVTPDPEVIWLIEALVACVKISPAIVSGRRLAHLRQLIPISEIVLAGSYGLEIQFPEGKSVHRVQLETVRPHIEALKPIWQGLIEGESPFYLEDKGWALAIHARYVKDEIAEQVLIEARKLARDRLDPDIFQIEGGHKFLEASPIQADKGKCVGFLIERMSLGDAALVYLGDDDKDEKAFAVVQSRGGVAIRVCSNVINQPIEDWRLGSPQASRAWLWSLVRGCV